MKKCFAVAPVLGLLLMLGFAGSARAQDTGQQANRQWDAGQLYATRADLQARLRRFEDASNESGYSAAVRMPAKDEAQLIRDRLRDGDFEVGDVVTLSVLGQPSLSAPFTISPGRLLVLPDLGAMPLTGLLRSELKDSVTAFITRYIRDPTVFVSSSMRIQTVGEIGKVGYQLVSPDARLPDVIAALGQPTRAAKLEDMKIKRGKQTIWDGPPLQQAMVEGRTLDDLSLRAGDVIEIPAVPQRNIGQLIRSMYYVIPLTFAIIRLF